MQEVVEDALSLKLRQTITVTGCGRTDTGVHATDYYAHFELDHKLDDLNQLTYELNKLIDKNIRIYSVFEVDSNLHSRFDAISRTYIYQITNEHNPFLSQFSWNVKYDLDLEKMNKACEMLIGTREFDCFCKAGGNNKTSICTISFARFTKTDEIIRFQVSANRFLRNMVRAMVGTLVDVGRNKISLSEFETILNSGNRSDAGASVPAKGLFLCYVSYSFSKLIKLEPEQFSALIPIPEFNQ